MVTSDACISRFFGYNCKSRTAVARDIHPYYRVQIPPRLQNHQNTSNIALKATRCRQGGKQFFTESYLWVRPVWGELGGVPDQQRGEVDEVVLAADTLHTVFILWHVVQDLFTSMSQLLIVRVSAARTTSSTSPRCWWGTPPSSPRTGRIPR